MVKVRAKLDPTAGQMQLKVALLDIKPAIWRRLLVPATIKLPKLHAVLQFSFGWTNSHLSEAAWPWETRPSSSAQISRWFSRALLTPTETPAAPAG